VQEVSDSPIPEARDVQEAPAWTSRHKLSLGCGVVVLLAILSIFAARAIHSRLFRQEKIDGGKEVLQLLAAHEEHCAELDSDLPPSTGPFPPDIADLRGRPYMLSPDMFNCTRAEADAKPTRFDSRGPSHFQYEWVRQSRTNGIVRGRSDLDGDGSADMTYEIVVSCTAGGKCSHNPEPVEISP
jgi:hypothetical protein